jgi:hypothetical protein
MSSKDVPSDAKKPRQAREPALGRASESGDPAVQQLLAEIEIHRSNGDDDKVRDTAARLARLGFE